MKPSDFRSTVILTVLSSTLVNCFDGSVMAGELTNGVMLVEWYLRW